MEGFGRGLPCHLLSTPRRDTAKSTRKIAATNNKVLLDWVFEEWSCASVDSGRPRSPRADARSDW